MPVIKKEIVKENIILCEGEDAFHFIRAYLERLEKNDKLFSDFQVLNFGGNEQLPRYLNTFTMLPNSNIVKSITIVRDAEYGKYSPDSEIQSIKSALKNSGFGIPPHPNEIMHDGSRKIKIAFSLFPTLSENASEGTLEDLFMKNLSESPSSDELINDIDVFINGLKEKGRYIPRIHKSKLYTYFAVTDKFTSLKLAEAAKAGAFRFDCVEMDCFKKLLKELSENEESE